MKDNKRNITLIIVTILVAILSGFGFYETNKDKSTDEIINNGLNEVIQYIEMTDKEIKELPTTEIVEQTEEEEKVTSAEQEVESEGFELQGEIAYEGDKARSWNVELGDYRALTYYNQRRCTLGFKNVQLNRG